MSNEIRTALENLLDAMDQMGSCQYETLRSDARAALNRAQGDRGAEAVEFEDYAAGPLNDWGGGNVPWWMEYIRTEVERANEHWREQIESLPLHTQPQPAVPEGWRAILEEALAMMTSQPMTLERQADAVTGVRSLLSTPTTPQVDGWVSMADREPTKSDEDCEGKIWLLWPDRRYFERVPRGHVSCAPEFYWMPTGLKRPQPPKREAPGDE